MSDDRWRLARNGEPVGDYSLSDLVASAARNGIPVGVEITHPRHTKGRWVSPLMVKPIREAAASCRPAVPARRRQLRNGIQPAVASVLTLFLPGLGQFAQGRILAGAFVLVAVPIGYVLFIVPGLLFHLCAVIDCLANGEE